MWWIWRHHKGLDIINAMSGEVEKWEANIPTQLRCLGRASRWLKRDGGGGSMW
jgi:hypothetical protein